MSTKSTRRKSFISRITATFCAVVICVNALPIAPVFAQTDAPPAVTVRKGPTTVEIFEPKLNLSEDPADDELSTARTLSRGLIPLGSKAAQLGENRALRGALIEFRSKNDPEDLSQFEQFLKQFPDSHWRPALELNMAQMRLETGYLSDALSLFRSSWEGSKNETGLKQMAIASEALSQLMALDCKLGRKDEVAQLLKETKSRPVHGSNESRLESAKASLDLMQTQPEIAYKCGPYAVNIILNHLTNHLGQNPVIAKADSTTRGTNLFQLKEWAGKCGLHFQMAKRSNGSSVIVPAVVHWKSGHFSAVITKHQNRYQFKDPTFGTEGNFWISARAIDSESDGYCLVPDGPLPVGWQSVSDNEGREVWGRGTPAFRDNNSMTPKDPKNCDSGDCCGMTRASSFTMQATLNLMDTPLSYSPPIGPDMDFLLNYNYLETNQPAVPAFSTFGPNWTFNWISYLTVDASKNATVRVRGGGSELFNFEEPNNITNPYKPQVVSQAVLIPTGSNTYQRRLPDGSYEVFDQPDGTGRIFMTKVVDPQGNSAIVTYNANFRVSSITDAIGQVTVLTYLSNSTGNDGYYKISKITDPFTPGREANFTFDSTLDHIISITDVIGLQSQFTYESGSSFIRLMTTPYGVTSFRNYTPTNGTVRDRGFRTTYPDGTAAVIENFLVDATSFYWDRHAMQLYPGDPGSTGVHSKTTHFMRGELSSGEASETTVKDWEKPALESQITFTYKGESAHSSNLNNVGVNNKPITISRALDVGTQTSTFEYNDFGHMTKSIDPIGRTFSYFYSGNGVDLLEVRETRSTNNFLLGKWQYNNQHLPLVYIDGSGQKTQYSYNSAGQILTSTDANNKVTTYGYTGNYLTSIDGPLPGDKDKTTIAYDGYGRVFTVTDSEGYVVQSNYDSANRLTKTTYPDGTFEEFRYDRLDQVASKDRIGRWTVSSYNSMDELVKVVDPLGRATQYTWCSCGSLVSLTDGANNTTTWHHDLEGRLIEKEYADSTTTNYVYENNTSRLKSRTDALNQVTTYSYNADDTLSGVVYTNEINPTSDVTLTWSPDYRRISTVQNGWGTLTYTYNDYITNPFASPTTGGGMLQSVTNNVIANSAISYSYDSLGRTTNRQINGASNSVTWVFDEMSRVTSETNALGSFGYSYVDQTAPGGDRGTTRLSSISYPNSQATNFSYFDNTGDQRLKQINNLNSSGGMLSQFSYGYNSAGEITQWQQNQNGNNLTYKLGYDRAGQLASAQAGSGSPVAPFGKEYYYNYDSAANRTAAQSSSVETLRVGGTKTTNDVLTITVTDQALTGGQKSVSYTVQAGDTIPTIAAGLAAAITADASMQAIGVNASSYIDSVKIRSASPNITSYTKSTSGGATETLTFGPHGDGSVNATIAGTKTTNDVLTIRVKDSGLAGGQLDVSYTVLSGDTLVTIATGVKNAINANTTLQALGVTATSVSTIVNLRSKSPNFTSFDKLTSGGATETISLSLHINPIQFATIAGSKTTGDILTVTVFDAGLPSGKQAVSYTVQGGDTLTSIATGISGSINANTNLNTANIKATSSGTTISIRSPSTTLTSYSQSVNAGGTETINLSINPNPIQIVSIAGSKTTSDVLTITIANASIPTDGIQTISYTVLAGDTLTTIATGLKTAINADTDLQTAGISSVSSGSRIAIESNSINPTSIRKDTNNTATEALNVAPKKVTVQTATIGGTKSTGDVMTITVYDTGLTGNSKAINYTVLAGDTLASIATAVAAAIAADTSLQAIGVTANAVSTVVNITSTSVDTTTYTRATSGPSTETITLAPATGVMLSGYNNVNELTSLGPGGAVALQGTTTKAITSASTTVNGGAAVAANLGWSQSFSAQPSLPIKENSVSVSATDAVPNVKSNSYQISNVGTSYVPSTSGGATITVTMGANTNGNSKAILAGTITAGNIITLTTHNPALSAGPEPVSYTIQGGDTINLAATGLKNAINASTRLQAIGVSATSAGAVVTITASGPGSTTLTFDANGNMTGDGKNTYLWDAENRLVQINYPGSGNNSQFSFDGLGRNIKILEQSGGSTTSTKQFVWCANERCEEREGSGVLTKQFFSGGQRNSSTNYMYALDHLNSIREVTDSSATIQAQYAFDPYGRVIKLQGSLTADFQYAGYYQHAPSALNLTLNRSLSPILGRWICRDPIEEKGGTNLFAYCRGNPIVYRDPVGLDFGGALLGAAAGAALGGLSGGILGGSAGTLAAPGVGTVGVGGFGGGQGAAAGAAIGAAWGLNNIQSGYGWGDAASSLSTLLSSGNSGAGSGSGSGTGTINCRPDPCEPPPHAFKNKEACYDYCRRNCTPTSRLGKCALTCFKYFPYAGPPSGSGGALPPFPHIFKP